jgi:hypothetical protein
MGVIMKGLLLTAILGIALLAPALARADASEQGCKSSDDRAKGCTKDATDPTTVPEPGIAILTGSGLLALGGLVLLRRKQESN